MSRAFTLIELLVSIAVIALLLGLLVPTLGAARDTARGVVCQTNLRQTITAWTMYAGDHDGFALPAGDVHANTHWWGRLRSPSEPGAGPGPSSGDLGVMPDGRPAKQWVDHSASPMDRYLAGGLGERSVYECPSQAWGTYKPQGQTATPTSTYGYNGYYLTPAASHWADAIRHRPWQRLFALRRPTELLVFADTMMFHQGNAKRSSFYSSNALLDPPSLFENGAWKANGSPTTAFRHASVRANAAHADGSVLAHTGQTDTFVGDVYRVGFVSSQNGPRYVPDWRRWE